MCIQVYFFFFRQSRLTAYRQFVCWMWKGERLGKGIRVVIPSYVVLAIRNRFPVPNNSYTGFRSVVEDMRDLFSWNWKMTEKSPEYWNDIDQYWCTSSFSPYGQETDTCSPNEWAAEFHVWVYMVFLVDKAKKGGFTVTRPTLSNPPPPDSKLFFTFSKNCFKKKTKKVHFDIKSTKKQPSS